MNAFDRQQALAVLLLLAMALLVATSFPPAARWRRELRFASITILFVAIVMTLVEIARWLTTRGG